MKSSIKKDPKEQPLKKNWRVEIIPWMLVLFILIFGSLLMYIQVMKFDEAIRMQTTFHEKELTQQFELAESIRGGNWVFLLSKLLEQVEAEIKMDPARKLSEESISRIAALSYSLTPYRYPVGDSLSAKSYSPERGQLLLALSKMNIDSASFDKIKRTVSFEKVNLQNADLREADLSGVNLSESNLSGADLRGINLFGCDLSETNLWGANLTEANLDSANLYRADLSWADLSRAKLNKAYMNSVNLTSAKLKGASLIGADLSLSTCIGTFFNSANLNDASLFWANLAKSNFQNADLSRSNLISAVLIETTFNEAILKETNMINAIVDRENWIEYLSGWNVREADSLGTVLKVEYDKNKGKKFSIKKIK
ncbi:MAG: pentapeptide repeat-containing protein [Bacteroidota bacterium]